MRIWNWLKTTLRNLLISPGFAETLDHGVPNFSQIATHLWRSGQPEGNWSWLYVRQKLHEVEAKPIFIYKLNTDKEGSDDFAATMYGVEVVKIPLPPEDGEPWSVIYTLSLHAALPTPY